MNYLTSFLTAICAASVFIGALYMLCPDGAMSKTVTYVLGLCFILCVTAASGVTVKNIDFTFTPSEYTYADSSESLIASAEYTYSFALKSAGIDFSKITVCTTKNDSGSISISKVEIVSKESAEKIRAALGEAAQLNEVQIINE